MKTISQNLNECILQSVRRQNFPDSENPVLLDHAELIMNLVAGNWMTFRNHLERKISRGTIEYKPRGRLEVVSQALK